MSEYSNLPELTEFIKYILFSDYVVLDAKKKETALSALVVAPVESGKTALINQFSNNDGILYLTDATAWGIQKHYLPMMRQGRIKRIMIPDLINPTNRKKATVDSIITFFNSYISWEGVGSIATYAMHLELKEPINGSLLTTMATKDFKRMVKGLAAVGFLSRLMILGYSYDQFTVDTLLEDIIEGRAGWDKITLQLPEQTMRVEMDLEQAKKLTGLAKVIGQRCGASGFRALNQLVIMCKSRALSCQRDIVNDEDVARIMWLGDRYIGNIPLDERTKKRIRSMS